MVVKDHLLDYDPVALTRWLTIGSMPASALPYGCMFTTAIIPWSS